MVVHIDGSILEGGGQLLRMALAYSVVSSLPIKVSNIRIKRPDPGLKPQHLTAARALANLSGAKTGGLEIGSREIEFAPKGIRGGHYEIDIGTAGSIGLLLQSLAPAASFAPTSVSAKIRGGTEVRWGVPVLALKEVIWPLLGRMGFRGEIDVLREGFYPKGGGIVKVLIEPVKRLRALRMTEMGHVKRVEGVSMCGRLPSHVAERQARAARKFLAGAGYENVAIEVDVLSGKRDSLSPGSLVILWATTSTGCLIEADSLGERGKPAEVVGREAARLLADQLATGAAVDLHTGDNLVIWLSLAEGRSELTVSKLTMHTLTAIELARRIVGSEFSVEGKLGEKAKIVCEGAGLVNRHL
ncbi:MAG: RNA 3'-terminal phosphate cyclase [Candidatus Bathyarchaeia archaeon]